MSEFKRGDILRNNYAGECNPTRFIMYLRKCTYQKNKAYECIAYNGGKVHFFVHDHALEKVSHMDEFDAFMRALKKLRWFDNV